MTRRKLLLMGHSHLATLMHAMRDPAWADTDPALADCTIDFLILRRDDFVLVRGDAVLEQIPRDIETADRGNLSVYGKRDRSNVLDLLRRCLPGADAAAFQWRGNQHNRRAIPAVGPPFDVMLPGDPAQETPSTGTVPVLVPHAAVASGFSASLEREPLLEEALRVSEPLVPVRFLLSPPPPLCDAAVHDAFLASTHPEALLYSSIAKTHGLDGSVPPMAPARVRRKVWQILVDVYEQYGRRFGVGFLPSPPESEDEHGLLARAYCGPGITHANPAYGRLRLSQVAGSSRRIGPAMAVLDDSAPEGSR